LLFNYIDEELKKKTGKKEKETGKWFKFKATMFI
jgi:hypothetical protein